MLVTKASSDTDIATVTDDGIVTAVVLCIVVYILTILIMTQKSEASLMMIF